MPLNNTAQAVADLRAEVAELRSFLGATLQPAEERALAIVEADAPEASEDPESAAFAYFEAINWLKTASDRAAAEKAAAEKPKGKGK